MTQSVRVGRNDPCPCGSGRKYKKCHLEEHEREQQKSVVGAQPALGSGGYRVAGRLQELLAGHPRPEAVRADLLSVLALAEEEGSEALTAVQSRLCQMLATGPLRSVRLPRVLLQDAIRPLAGGLTGLAPAELIGRLEARVLPTLVEKGGPVVERGLRAALLDSSLGPEDRRAVLLGLLTLMKVEPGAPPPLALAEVFRAQCLQALERAGAEVREAMEQDRLEALEGSEDVFVQVLFSALADHAASVLDDELGALLERGSLPPMLTGDEELHLLSLLPRWFHEDEETGPAEAPARSQALGQILAGAAQDDVGQQLRARLEQQAVDPARDADARAAYQTVAFSLQSSPARTLGLLLSRRPPNLVRSDEEQRLLDAMRGEAGFDFARSAEYAALLEQLGEKVAAARVRAARERWDAR